MKLTTAAVGVALVLTGMSGCTPRSTVPAPAPRTVPPASRAQELPALQKRVHELVNEHRRRAGVPPLAWNRELAQAAGVHAANMAKRQVVAHTIPGVEQHSLTMRAAYAGYEFARITENVAAGQRSAEDVVAAWLGSRGHRANILDGRVRETAVGVHRAADGTLYYCQVFGAQQRHAAGR